MTAADELQLTPEYIDERVDRVLCAAGSGLKYYMPSSKEKLRQVMKQLLEAERSLAAQADGVKQ